MVLFTFVPHYKETMTPGRLRGNYRSLVMHGVERRPRIPEQSIGIQYVRSNIFLPVALASSTTLGFFAAGGAGLCTRLGNWLVSPHDHVGQRGGGFQSSSVVMPGGDNLTFALYTGVGSNSGVVLGDTLCHCAEFLWNCV